MIVCTYIRTHDIYSAYIRINSCMHTFIHTYIHAPTVESGASPNRADPHGRHALHLAAQRGSVDLIRRLLQAKANVCAKDKELQSVLHHAARAGSSVKVCVSLWVCMLMCVILYPIFDDYIYIYIYIYRRISLCSNKTHTSVYIDICMHACIHASLHIHTYMRAWKHTHTHTHAPKRTRASVCVCYSCVMEVVYVYTRMHTYACSG
jgi:hypothetical protein